MGAITGYRQVSLYVEPETYRLTKMLVVKTKRTVYQIVNDALRAEIDKHMSPVERKAIQSFLSQEVVQTSVQPASKGAKKRVSKSKARPA